MTRGDDDLDNLLRDHFAGELSPLRGQAGRAFAREVLHPMRRSLAHDKWQMRIRTASQSMFTMAACTALGFFIPQWLASGPGSPGGGSAAGLFLNPTVVDYQTPAKPGQFEVEPAPMPRPTPVPIER